MFFGSGTGGIPGIGSTCAAASKERRQRAIAAPGKPVLVVTTASLPMNGFPSFYCPSLAGGAPDGGHGALDRGVTQFAALFDRGAASVANQRRIDGQGEGGVLGAG